MSLVHFYHDPLVDFDRLFDGAFATLVRPSVLVDVRRDLFRPRMDVHESEDANLVTITLDLPGMSPDDVTVEVYQNRLTVSGGAGTDRSREEGGRAVRERSYGKFSRTLQLPTATKPDDVKAKMADGVLTVTFPKTTPERRARRIAVQ